MENERIRCRECRQILGTVDDYGRLVVGQAAIERGHVVCMQCLRVREWYTGERSKDRYTGALGNGRKTNNGTNNGAGVR